MSLPACSVCGEQIICRMRMKEMNGKKIVVRDKDGNALRVCFCPNYKNHP